MASYSTNHAYLVDEQRPRKARKSEETPPPRQTTRLALCLSHEPQDLTRGFTFGSDKQCDIRLDSTNERGVSARHFRVWFNFGRSEPDALRVTNISRNGTEIDDYMRADIQYYEFSPGETAIVKAGEVAMEFKFLEGLREKHWINLRQRVACAVPSLGSVTLAHSSQPTPNKTTAAILCWRELGVAWKSGSRYESKTQIGKGTRANVRECRRVGETKLYAVKILSSQWLHEATTEIDTLSCLAHNDYICQLVDYGETGSPVTSRSLVLEHAEHGTVMSFFEHYNRMPLPEAFCRTLCLHMLRAAEYCHGKGYIHCDINPENMLIFSYLPGKVWFKLCDFGSACCMGGERPADFATAPAYAAPETLFTKRKQTPYNERIDIYSLSAVIFHMLTGLPGVSVMGKHSLPMLRRLMREAIAAWHPSTALSALDLSEGGLTLLESMLQQNPEHRPTASKCLRSEWPCEWPVGNESDDASTIVPPEGTETATPRAHYSEPHDQSDPHASRCGSLHRRMTKAAIEFAACVNPSLPDTDVQSLVPEEGGEFHEGAEKQA